MPKRWNDNTKTRYKQPSLATTQQYGSKTNVEIRDGNRQHQHDAHLNRPPPVKGKHKYTSCHKLYIDIHNFLNQRGWAPLDIESNEGGTTWLELFILFDTTQSRSTEGNHIRDLDVARRGVVRCSRSAKTKNNRKLSTY